jgi:hypothetical protein
MSLKQNSSVEGFFRGVAVDLFSGPYIERYDPAVLAADKRMGYGEHSGSFTYLWASTAVDTRMASEHSQDPDISLTAWHQTDSDFPRRLAPETLTIKKLQLRCNGMSLIFDLEDEPTADMDKGIGATKPGLSVENDFEWYFVEAVAKKLVEDGYSQEHPIMQYLDDLRNLRLELDDSLVNQNAA